MVRKTIILIIIYPAFSFSQSPIDLALNYLQNRSTFEADWENTSIILEEYLSHPIPINNLRLSDIQRFPLLNTQMYFSIKKYIRINGPILSQYELMNIPLLSSELSRIIAPFVIYKSNLREKTTKGYWMHKTSFNTKKQKGFTRLDSNKFKGNFTQETTRIKVNPNQQKWALTWKKDKGEMIQHSFFKMGVERKFKGYIKQLNVGSYSVHLGEGLIHSNKFIVGKSTPLIGFFKIEEPLKINASSNNVNYENGIALKLGASHFQSLVFFSTNYIHGTQNGIYTSSIKTDGLFRTNSDLLKLRANNYKLMGTSHSWFKQKIRLSINSIFLDLKSPYTPELTYYNSSYGYKNLRNNSISYRYFNGSRCLKGEFALDQNLNIATSHSYIFTKEAFNFLIGIRSFAPSYKSFRTQSLSEGSRIQNEAGCFIAFDYNTKNICSYMSTDIFQFRAPKYKTHLPSFGQETSGFIKYQLNDSLAFKVYYKHEYKQSDIPGEFLDQLKRKDKQRIYLQLKINTDAKITLVSRVDYSKTKFGKDQSNGSSSFIELIKALRNSQVSTRMTFFNIDTWEDRIYLYEKDVLHHFSTTPFHKKGIRYYINYNHSFNKHIKFWIKASRTVFQNQLEIGSGNDEITGNKRTEFRFQIQLKL